MRVAMPKQIVNSIAVLSLFLIVACLFFYQVTERSYKTNTRIRQSLKTNKWGDETDPMPTDDVLQNMSLRQLSDFFHGYIHGTQALCSRRVRMGSIDDGGWDVCEDPHYKLDPSNCLVYSFGISHDYSFDAAMQKYGCEVHSYDPSLGDYDPSKGQQFYFHKVGIGAKNSNKAGEWTIHTQGKTREMNHHGPSERRLDVVKMDVEGDELSSLRTALDEGSLQDVGQLYFEIHLRSTGTKSVRLIKKNVLSILSLLRRLWREGFRLYHTNRNLFPTIIFTNAPESKLRTRCHELYMIRTRRQE